MRTVAASSALLGFAVIGAQALINGTIDGPIVPGTTGKLGNASVVTTNPVGVTYTAILPDTPNSSVRGYVAGTSNANGTGVNFNINIYGLPDASLGPFSKLTSLLPVYEHTNALSSVPHPRRASARRRQLHQDPSPSRPDATRRDPTVRPEHAGRMPGRRSGG